MRNSLSMLMAMMLLGGTGCEIRKAMYDQPKYRPLQKSEFFADARASRPLVAGTVARDHLNEDAHLYTGKVGDQLVDTFPFPVTREVLVRGQERFNVFCAPCHDRAGTGNGMVVQRGFKKPVSFHDPRLRTSPPGYFFNNITMGFGQMPSYAAQIPVRDRWAITAYIRALQLSQNATVDDVPEDQRAALTAAAAPATH
jgi:hypothetical protein